MEVAGFIFGAATLFQSTLSVYSIYSEARDIGKISTDHQIRIRVEKCRYTNWGQYAGIDKGTLNPELQSLPSKTIELILDLLACIAQALLDSGKLEEKYHPKKTDYPSPIEALAQPLEQPPDSQYSIPLDKSCLASDINIRLKRYTELAQEVKSDTKLTSRFKFALWGKDKFEALITKLKELNDGLDNITIHQKRLDARLMLRLLHTQSASELSVLGNATETAYPAISEIANRKATYLELRDRQLQQKKTRKPNPNDNDPELRLGYSEVILQGNHCSGRGFGIYKGSSVMVEWKVFSDEMSEDESLCRIRDVAKFLSKDYPSNNGSGGLFRSLRCLGYFHKPGQTDRAALVYQTSQTTYQTLMELLKNPGQECLNLGARYRISSSLAEYIFYLHITGWLHKSINSENIIISGDTSNHWETKALRPYLLGFNAARPNCTAEKSEKFDIDCRTDLYQHPDYQNSNKDEARYTRQYDIYSLGLVLLELGTWETIEEGGRYKASKYKPIEFLRKLLKGSVRSLSFNMGNAYRRAVFWCLQGQFEGNGQKEYASLNDEERSMMFWDNVVLELAKCSAEE